MTIINYVRYECGDVPVWSKPHAPNADDGRHASHWSHEHPRSRLLLLLWKLTLPPISHHQHERLRSQPGRRRQPDHHWDGDQALQLLGLRLHHHLGKYLALPLVLHLLRLVEAMRLSCLLDPILSL